MWKKTILTTIAIILQVIFCNTQIFASDVTKNVNYNTYNMGSIAINYQGHYYLPLREFCEQIHYNVSYNTSNKDITVYDNRDKIVLSSSGVLTVNGAVVDKKMFSIIRNGKTYIPAIFFSKSLGFEVQNNKSSFDIFGVNMYDLKKNKDGEWSVVIYSKDGVLSPGGRVDIIIPMVSDSAFLNRAEISGANLTSYNEHKDDDVYIKEVYRTPLNNDIVDFYKYNGDNIIPSLTTIIYSNTTRNWDAFRKFSNIGLVYSSLDVLKPSQLDIEYYQKSISDRNNPKENMYAFIDTSPNFTQPNAGGKTNVVAYSDETMTSLSAYSNCAIMYLGGAAHNGHRSSDMLTRVNYIDKAKMSYTIRTLGDEIEKEHSGTAYFFTPDEYNNEYTEMLEYK